MSAWFAVRVKTRQEKSATAQLSRVDGIDAFLPTQRIRRAWSDRVRASDEALFPGYLFIKCSLSAERVLSIRKIRSVVNIVGWQNGIAPEVSADVISALQTMVGLNRKMKLVDFMPVGSTVEVAAGPLRGLTGVLLRADDALHLVIEIKLLGQSVCCTLDSSDVIPSPPSEQPISPSRRSSHFAISRAPQRA